MKIVCSLLCFFISITTLQAQTPAEQVADKIARKMKDTLQLTENQKIQIYQLNLQIAQQKTYMRTQFAGTDSVRIKIQMVENTRDSLYHIVLPNEKYWLYIQKKRSLVNNN